MPEKSTPEQQRRVYLNSRLSLYLERTRTAIENGKLNMLNEIRHPFNSTEELSQREVVAQLFETIFNSWSNYQNPSDKVFLKELVREAIVGFSPDELVEIHEDFFSKYHTRFASDPIYQLIDGTIREIRNGKMNLGHLEEL